MQAATRILSIWSDIKDWISDILGSIFSIIPKFIYLLTSMLLTLVDVIQLLFRKLAGLDTYYVVQDSANVEIQSGDILTQFLKRVILEEGVLNDVFWGLIVIGLVLLFLASVVAVARSQYSTDDAKGSADVFKKLAGNLVRAMVSFVVIPACCIFGVYLSNTILNAIEAATNPSSVILDEESAKILHQGKVGETYIYNADTKLDDMFQDENVVNKSEFRDSNKTYKNYDLFGMVTVGCKYTPFSGTVFKAAASRANRVRTDNSGENNSFYAQLKNDPWAKNGAGSGGEPHKNNPTSTFGLFVGDSPEEIAQKIDDAFANCYRLKKDYRAWLNLDATYGDRQICMTVLGSLDPTFITYTVPVCYFSKYNVGLVWYYYDLWKFDFVIAIGSLVVITMVFLNICLGLVKRLFELVVLTIIAPGVIGLSPLDNGDATKKWRQQYVKKTISAYAAVAAINLLYLFLAEFEKIKFFNIALVDNIISALFVIACLVSVKGLIGTLSEIIGAEDAHKAGDDMAGDFAKTAAKTAHIGLGMASTAGKAAKFLSPGGAALHFGGKGITKAAKAIADKRKETLFNRSGGETTLESIAAAEGIETSDPDALAAWKESDRGKEVKAKMSTKRFERALKYSGSGAFAKYDSADPKKKAKLDKLYGIEATDDEAEIKKKIEKYIARGYEGDAGSVKRFHSLEEDDALRGRRGHAAITESGRKMQEEGWRTFRDLNTVLNDASSMMFGSASESKLAGGFDSAKKAGIGPFGKFSSFFRDDGSLAGIGSRKEALNKDAHIQKQQHEAQMAKDDKMISLLEDIKNKLT